MNRNRGISYIIGNTLIIISLLGLSITFFPVILLYIHPKVTQASSETASFSITIPKINAFAPIIDNVDPWNEKEYKKALQHGVAHAKNTAEPGNPGTIYLFAHSSGLPWELTYFNTIFLRIGELTKNDSIIIRKDNIYYHYAVIDKKIISPNDVSYLVQSTKNMLILQTCTPIGTSLNRLLVFAIPVTSH